MSKTKQPTSTPMPWRISGDADSDTLWLEGPAPEYRIICHFGVETPRRRADAELILRAIQSLVPQCKVPR